MVKYYKFLLMIADISVLTKARTARTKHNKWLSIHNTFSILSISITITNFMYSLLYLIYFK